ncbi:MAG TPA: DUF4126 domain-containing protein [Terriglobales bacterium]|nr:DUF4126 domain-containing protein [Terriglobales bacterium]
MSWDLNTAHLLGVLVAASFAAGLNVYATVATLGLLSRAGLFDLPPALHMIASWWVIGIAALLFAVEFFADKIPAFDLLWNALQTFVRVPVAALIAWGATAQLSPADQVLATALGAAIAFAAHSGKIAARAAVSPSPEPVSNSLLSLAEDLVAVGLTWFATQHPYLAGAIVAVLLVVLVLLIRWVWRAMKALFRGAGEELRALEHRA